jgi:hypothetical protein
MSGNRIPMDSDKEARIIENLQRLRNMAPKREDFSCAEQHAEAKSGFIHRIGPSIRLGESLLKQIREAKDDEG